MSCILIGDESAFIIAENARFTKLQGYQLGSGSLCLQVTLKVPCYFNGERKKKEKFCFLKKKYSYIGKTLEDDSDIVLQTLRTVTLQADLQYRDKGVQMY